MKRLSESIGGTARLIAALVMCRDFWVGLASLAIATAIVGSVFYGVYRLGRYVERIDVHKLIEATRAVEYARGWTECMKNCDDAELHSGRY